MNNSQKDLIKLLNLALRGKRLNDFSEDFDWNSVLDEANAHEIGALVYSAVYGVKFLNGLEDSKLEEWKRKTFLTGVGEISHINQISRVLTKFNEEDIKLIILKGLVVRELYPKPELRTMGDADILVQEKDLDRVGILLKEFGYKQASCEDEHGAHIVFTHNMYKPIEVHWTLINDDYFIGTKEFEESIWDNAVEVRIGKSKGLALGLEDQALHLCLHMAVHIVCGGFGLRQLSDLALFIEQEGSNINWESFMVKGKEIGAEKFIIAIFKCCEILFSVEIPKELKININEEIVEDLIQNIFNSGVFGRKDVTNNLSGGFAYSKGDKEKKRSISKKYITMLFPNVEAMSDKYDYAKKNKVLTPVAWAHHLGAGAFNKNYSFKNKVDFLTKSVNKGKKKRELLEELDLMNR